MRFLVLAWLLDTRRIRLSSLAQLSKTHQLLCHPPTLSYATQAGAWAVRGGHWWCRGSAARPPRYTPAACTGYTVYRHRWCGPAAVGGGGPLGPGGSGCLGPYVIRAHSFGRDLVGVLTLHPRRRPPGPARRGGAPSPARAWPRTRGNPRRTETCLTSSVSSCGARESLTATPGL